VREKNACGPGKNVYDHGCSSLADRPVVASTIPRRQHRKYLSTRATLTPPDALITSHLKE